MRWHCEPKDPSSAHVRTASAWKGGRVFAPAIHSTHWDQPAGGSVGNWASCHTPTTHSWPSRTR
jgi:hypothetical protein